MRGEYGYLSQLMTGLDGADGVRRFVDDALGFALTWNYWFNDAVSTAADIIALQLLLQFWTDNFPGWAISLIFLLVVIGLNVMSVRVYGEVCSSTCFTFVDADGRRLNTGLVC